MLKLLVLSLGLAFTASAFAASNVCVDIAGSDQLKEGQIDLCARLASINTDFFSEVFYADSSTPRAWNQTPCKAAQKIARNRAHARCALVAAHDGRDVKACVELSTFVTSNRSIAPTGRYDVPNYTCEAESVYYLDSTPTTVSFPVGKVDYDRLLTKAHQQNMSVPELVARVLNGHASL